MSHVFAAHAHGDLIRVLIVDDAPKVVAGLSRLLSKQPGLAVVAVAFNGREALTGVVLHTPDLVVMDVHMPGMDGLAATALLHAHHPRVRIILISIDQEAHVQAECHRLGADSFLPKIGLQRRLPAEIARLFPRGPAPDFPREAHE